MRLILFDCITPQRINFHPLVLGRPIFELRCGMTSLGDKLVAKVAASDVACFVPPYMADVYRAKTSRPVNDVASLQEVLHRRFSRISKASEDFPDLVLVDGGKGQFNAARTVLESLGLGDTPLVSLAKREEIVYSERFPQGLNLDRTSPALRLLQNIRDEAHRFAIAFHRRRRTKKSFASLLDGIPGIGPKRKALLLSRYTSISAIRDAPQKELAPLIGTSAAAALQQALED